MKSHAVKKNEMIHKDIPTIYNLLPKKEHFLKYQGLKRSNKDSNCLNIQFTWALWICIDFTVNWTSIPLICGITSSAQGSDYMLVGIPEGEDTCHFNEHIIYIPLFFQQTFIEYQLYARAFSKYLLSTKYIQKSIKLSNGSREVNLVCVHMG